MNNDLLHDLSLCRFEYYQHRSFVLSLIPQVKTAKKCQNVYIRFVECHTGKLLYKFLVSSMFAVQMNVPFVIFLVPRCTFHTGITGKMLLNIT